MLDLDSNDIEQIETLETGLWLAEHRFDEAWLKQVFHDDFMEIGRSGTIYRREDFFPVEPVSFDCLLPLPNFTISQLASGVALTTYESVVTYNTGTANAHRSSTWIKTDSNVWQLRFHQGTAY